MLSFKSFPLFKSTKVKCSPTFKLENFLKPSFSVENLFSCFVSLMPNSYWGSLSPSYKKDKEIGFVFLIVMVSLSPPTLIGFLNPHPVIRILVFPESSL